MAIKFPIIVLFSKYFTHPIQLLRDECRLLASGNFEEQNSHITSRDEIGQLADDFKIMRSNLRNTMNELTQKNISLEREAGIRKESEAVRIKLEEELMQSQKLETVGLLAGGIAHDFNNLLTPILGYSDILSNQFTDGSVEFEMIGNIRKAGESARDLIQRILAFSRTQILKLEAVELSAVIKDFEKILRRTINETVKIEIRTPESPASILADRRQIEQVLINLSINAQDAMPESGMLLIELMNKKVDEMFSLKHLEIPPGDYVVLSVTDTGTGIDDKAREHIFDPFYTTKEVGKGTGLGLSTVYGIVLQHNGFIYFYSEKGHGTSFKIFFPAMSINNSAAEVVKFSKKFLSKGQETILLVEDNDMVRKLGAIMLQRLGYHVISKESPDKCLNILSEYDKIDLILTDIVMPGMNGREFFEHLKQTIPDLKVLYMSGYSNEVLSHHGIVDNNVDFIQKLFSISVLAEKIRKILDA